MAKFNESTSAQRDAVKRGYDSNAMHRAFGECIDRLKADIALLKPPVLVSEEQVKTVLDTWRDTKSRFFQCEATPTSGEAISRAVLALHEDDGAELPDDPKGIQQIWRVQTRFMWMILAGMGITTSLQNISGAARTAFDWQGGIVAYNGPNVEDLKRNLSVLWGEVLAQITWECGRHRVM